MRKGNVVNLEYEIDDSKTSEVPISNLSEHATNLKNSVEGNNLNNILYSLQELKIDKKDNEHCFFIVNELVDALASNNGKRLSNRYKFLIIKKAREWSYKNFLHRCFDKIPTQQTDINELISKLEQVHEYSDYIHEHTANLVYELEILKASIECLPNEKTIIKYAKNGFSELITAIPQLAIGAFFKSAIGVQGAKTIVLGPLKFTYNKLSKEFKKTWFLKILYLYILREKALEDIEFLHEILKELTEGSTKFNKENWQTIYACLDILTYILCNTKNDKITKLAYYGEANKYLGLDSFLDFKGYWFINNWIIRSKAIESSIRLHWLLSKDINKKEKEDAMLKKILSIKTAILLKIDSKLLQCHTSETDERVLYIINNPHKVIFPYRSYNTKFKKEDNEIVRSIKEAIKSNWKIQKQEQSKNIGDLSKSTSRLFDLLEKMNNSFKQCLENEKDLTLIIAFLINKKANTSSFLENQNTNKVLQNDSFENNTKFKIKIEDDEKSEKEDCESELKETNIYLQELNVLDNWIKKLNNKKWSSLEILDFETYIKKLLQLKIQQNIKKLDSLNSILGNDIQGITKDIKNIKNSIESEGKWISNIWDYTKLLYKEIKELNNPDEEINKIYTYSRNEWNKNLRTKFWAELQDIYIPVEGKLTKETHESKRFDLRDDPKYGVQHFLNSGQQKTLVILAESGSGKSVFMQMLEIYLKAESDWIPLLIPLSSIANLETGLVKEYLIDGIGIDNNKLSKLKNKKIVFLLDGYDEMDKKDGKSRKGLNLYISNKLYQWPNCKVIITCRDTFINKNIEGTYWKYFSSCPNSNQGKDHHNEVYLAPFKENQIKKYFKKYNAKYPNEKKWEVDEYLRQIHKMNHLDYREKNGLARIPVFLRLIADVLPDLAHKNLQTSRTDLFRAFMEKWFEREYLKFNKNNYNEIEKNSTINSYWRYARKLGKYMDLKYNKTNIKTFTWGEWNSKIFTDKRYFQPHKFESAFHALPLYRERKIVKKNSTKNKDCFCFWHLTFHDFLANEFDIHGLKNYYQDDDDSSDESSYDDSEKENSIKSKRRRLTTIDLQRANRNDRIDKKDQCCFIL